MAVWGGIGGGQGGAGGAAAVGGIDCSCAHNAVGPAHQTPGATLAAARGVRVMTRRQAFKRRFRAPPGLAREAARVRVDSLT